MPTTTENVSHAKTYARPLNDHMYNTIRWTWWSTWGHPFKSLTYFKNANLARRKRFDMEPWIFQQFRLFCQNIHLCTSVLRFQWWNSSDSHPSPQTQPAWRHTFSVDIFNRLLSPAASFWELGLQCICYRDFKHKTIELTLWLQRLCHKRVIGARETDIFPCQLELLLSRSHRDQLDSVPNMVLHLDPIFNEEKKNLWNNT